MILNKADKKATGLFTECMYNPVAFFLSNPELKYPYHFDDWINYFNNNKILYAAHVNKQTVAFLCLVKHDKNNCELQHLFIRTPYRKRSISKKIITMLLDDINYKQITVNLEDNQREHHKLFKELNFKKTDRQKEFLFESKPYSFSKWILEK